MDWLWIVTGGLIGWCVTSTILADWKCHKPLIVIPIITEVMWIWLVFVH